MKKNVLKWLGRVGATLLTTIVILVVGLYGVMAMLAWGPSKVAKKQFNYVTTGDRRAWF